MLFRSDITFTGRLVRNGRYEVLTQSGDIQFSPTGNDGFDLDVSTFSGDIRSDLTMTVNGTSRSTFDGRRGRGPWRSLKGTFGDASAVITLRSFNGDIVVSKRQVPDGLR